MTVNVNEYYPEYDFEISGASYIGDPKPNTVMYVGRKIAQMLSNLSAAKDVLCFTDEDVEVPEAAAENNAVIHVANPQLEYSRIAKRIADGRMREEADIGFDLINGSYISKSARIGANSYIEPGCFIGHGVSVGDNAVILSGSVIKHAVIGSGFTSNEGALIGTSSYTLVVNEEGNNIKIPSLGRVIIGDGVEIGANDNIQRGCVSDTVIMDYVIIDAMVHIGHDVIIEKNVEIAGGTMIGGFANIGEKTYMGLNSTLKNRISIGHDCLIGMGAAVMKSFPENLSIAGNPAKGIWKRDE